jgi:hypothetical protein
MILFAFIYWIGPDYERRPRWQFITPGAALAVVTWLLASAAFGWYVANYGSYGNGSIYGSLGSVIVFMLWLQLSMFALLLGAEVNQVLQIRARNRAVPPASAVAATGGGDHDGRASRRAPDTPAAERPVARVRLSDDAPAGARSQSAVALHDHDAPARGSRADGVTAAAGAHPRADAAQRRVPVPTLVGATVATVSSLIGLAGLFRRLKGG